MKSAFLLICLLAPALLAPASAEMSSLYSSPMQDARCHLQVALETIEKLQADDMFGTADVVLNDTGDPTALYPLMEEASKAGSAAATCWLIPQELNRLRVAGADLATHARAVELRARALAAVAKGYHPAFVQAANMLVAGVGGAVDEAEARRLLVEGSKRGSRQARAAFLMMSGRLQQGGAKDPAVEAELKRNNHDVEELLAAAAGDTAEGVAWLRRAMEHGSATAPFVLMQSDSADLSEKETMELLTLAAGRHNVRAMSLLGAIKMNANSLPGVPVEENPAEGLQWLRIAAALGDTEAQQSLANAMAFGLVEGGKAAAPQVCALFRMAAEQGHPEGMAGYGYCLLAGIGCKAEPEQGAALLQRGIDKGSRFGLPYLACACFNGTGMKPDLRRAVNALGEAAAMGHEHAYAIMAALTALGNEGTAPDAFRARVYLDMAKEDDPGAQAVYDELIARKGWRAAPVMW